MNQRQALALVWSALYSLPGRILALRLRNWHYRRAFNSCLSLRAGFHLRQAREIERRWSL